MGGRGSSFGVEIIAAVSPYGSQDAEIQELNVAGMTPMDRGSRFTNAEKTLDYLERKKLQETREQVQVLDDYGYVTRAFQGDEHSCAVDDKTQQYAQGKIVTHNHPSEYGGTFSDADISFLSLGMKELRASAKEGTYSIKAKKNAKMKGLNLDENLNRLIQENSDWAWEQAKRERAEMEKKQKTQGGTDGKKDEV